MKQKTKHLSNWKLGSLTSLTIMLLTIFACTEDKIVAQDLNNSSTEREVFTIVEEQPSYEGGMDALYRYMMNEVSYPAKARNNGVEGQVVAQFNIERDGSVSDLKIIKDIGAGCGIEVGKLIHKVATFKPGKQRGRTVKTTMLQPVNFKLDPTKTNADKSPQGSIAIGELQIKKERLQLDVKYKDGTWHGTLKDKSDKPLPGANIIVEGTNYGTVSGLDGTFSVDATASQYVTISYVGYENIRIIEEDRGKE